MEARCKSSPWSFQCPVMRQAGDPWRTAQEPVHILHDPLDRQQQPGPAGQFRIRSRACCIALSEGQRARKVTRRAPVRPHARTSRW